MSENTIEIEFQSEQLWIERSLPSQRTLEITLQPPAAIQTRTRPALNLALVLDRGLLTAIPVLSGKAPGVGN